MIELTRLNGKMVLVNPDHMRFIESCPDTLLTFVDGKTLVVKESIEQVNEKFIKCQQSYHNHSQFVSQGDLCK